MTGAVDETVRSTKLGPMKPYRRWILVPFAVLAVAASGCEHAPAPRRTDSVSASVTQSASSATAGAASGNWNVGIGPVLLVASDSADGAFVVAPDSANAPAELARVPHRAAVTLFGRGGTVQTADLPDAIDTSVCAVATLDAAPPPRLWSIGFVGGVVAPLPMDSLGSFSSADSTSLATGAIRLASALPNDSAGRFTGLPFTVVAIWRFTIPSGPQVVVATLSRQINQEATPLQERTMIIAERAASRDTMLIPAHSERSYGDEDTIESREPLAAALFGAARTPGIVVSHDFGNAVSYSILERVGDHQWRLRWSSGRRRC
jgi:hypothetical protein